MFNSSGAGRVAVGAPLALQSHLYFLSSGRRHENIPHIPAPITRYPCSPSTAMGPCDAQERVSYCNLRYE